MRFDQLSPDTQESAHKALEEARRTGPERILAANAKRRLDGVPQLTDSPCATLAHWPPVEFSPFSPQGDVENFQTPNKVRVLQKGAFTGFFRIWEEWAAMQPVIQILTGAGMTYEQAFGSLVEVGFHFSYGVVGMVTDGRSILVGIRYGNLNHSGRLSLPGGFVDGYEGQNLCAAAANEISEEAPGLGLSFSAALAAIQQASGAVTFGPHDKAPSATFVVPMATETMLPETVAANHEWAHRLLVAVPFAEVMAALHGELAPITARLARHGLIVTSGFAPDVAGPLAERFNPIMPR